MCLSYLVSFLNCSPCKTGDADLAVKFVLFLEPEEFV